MPRWVVISGWCPPNPTRGPAWPVPGPQRHSARKTPGVPRRTRMAFETWFASSPTLRTLFRLPGPPLGIPVLDFLQHPVEGLLQVDAFAIGDTDQDEENVGELHREIAFGLAGFLGLLAEPVVELAGQLAHLFGEPCQVREGVEVPFRKLGNPAVDPLLQFSEGHGSQVYFSFNPPFSILLPCAAATAFWPIWKPSTARATIAPRRRRTMSGWPTSITPTCGTS